jgi:hypothetical protein
MNEGGVPLKRNRQPIELFVALVAAGVLLLTAHGTEPRASSNRKIQRTIDQSRIDEIKREELDLRNLRARYINESVTSNDFDRSIIREQQFQSDGGKMSPEHAPPPPSPGIPIAKSFSDYQHNNSQGYQVARTAGADIVHFTWMVIPYLCLGPNLNKDVACSIDRYVAYNSYTISTNTHNQGFGGHVVGLSVLARAGYPNGDVFENNAFQGTLHQRADVSLPYNPWRLNFTTPGNSSHVDESLGGYGSGGCPEVLWPRIATSRDGDRTVHIISHSNTNDCVTDLLWYWRHNGTAWTGPVIIDSTPQISHVLADDPSGDKMAVAVNVSNHASMNGINNVAYLESVTDGAGWISGTETITKNVITNYNDEDGPGAWLHLSTAYDNAGVLHIIWDEQRDAHDDDQTAIRHWNSQRQTVRTVALGHYDTPYLTGVFNLNLAKMTIGIGDGGTLCQGGAESNQDYLYVLYTQFGGTTPEEQADHSLEGRYNGELYLTVSATGGNTWSAPVNLTNTKTPKCNPGTDSLGNPIRPDSVCRSEHWATIGMAVSDIDIFFISDLDAGGISQSEGTWQLNPEHYLRIPGGTTDAQHLCPLVSANFEATLTSDLECERHTGQNGTVFETLALQNIGNGALSGDITITDFAGAATLDVSGAPNYSIADGGMDDIRTVTLSANGAPEGLYSGLISITHNDPSEASPREYPIEFFVFNEFYCPQYAALKSGVASPGSLLLQVSNAGDFGNGTPEMGMWRHSDSSSSIKEGTLLISHGVQGPDTTVYHRLGTRASNGQNGFRALGDIVVDTTAYSTGAGCATATSVMTTADSVVGVTVAWSFPQDPEQDEVILARYKVYRQSAGTPITNLAIGILVEADALPASRLGPIQIGAENQPGSEGGQNLIWVAGVDTVGHMVSGTNTATRFRGGVAVPGGFEGAIVGSSFDDIQPGGGPSDGFLYRSLQNLAGIDLFSDSTIDLYCMISLDKNRSIAVGETLTYVLVYASDTISEASLMETIDCGIDIASAPNLCGDCGCSCPCWADPLCDGTRSNVQDVTLTVNVAFRAAAPVLDPACLFVRTDFDASGSTTVIDVVKVVNVAFRGQAVSANYVDPCAP